MGTTFGAGLGRAALLAITAAAVLIVVITLAAFTQGMQRARESEARQNLHAIQLALEKYAVDHSGVYPAYLIGGEARYAASVLPAAKTPQDAFAGLAECADQSQVSDPLLRDGYLTAYPRNPFLRDGREVYRAQQALAVYPQGGDPLRSGTAEARLAGTRFGARCELMGEVLADPRYPVFSAGSPTARDADRRPSYANVEYQFWDIWQGDKPKPYLPGEFLYKSAGNLSFSGASRGTKTPIYPDKIDAYIIAVYGVQPQSSKDVLASERPIPYYTSGIRKAGLKLIWPWTRSTNQPGKLYGSPLSWDQEVYPPIGYGNQNGIKDGVLFILSAALDFEYAIKWE